MSPLAEEVRPSTVTPARPVSDGVDSSESQYSVTVLPGSCVGLDKNRGGFRGGPYTSWV